MGTARNSEWCTKFEFTQLLAHLRSIDHVMRPVAVFAGWRGDEARRCKYEFVVGCSDGAVLTAIWTDVLRWREHRRLHMAGYSPIDVEYESAGVCGVRYDELHELVCNKMKELL